MEKKSMKKLVLAFVLVLGAACSNEKKIAASDVPPAVSAALMAKYPDADEIEWEMERDKDRVNYEAEFRSDGKKKEALFSADGKFIEED